jgi:cytochrome P450
MHLTGSPSHTYHRHELPRSAILPSTLQTLACRVRPLEYVQWCRHRLGSRFTVYPLDMPPLVFLSDPDDIRAVVTAPLNVLHPGAGASRTAPLFGERSFLLLEEDDYLCGRNAIAPVFDHRAVSEHIDSVTDLTEREVSSWPADAVIESHRHLSRLTLRVILKVVFGDGGRVIDELHGRLLDMLAVTASPVLQEPRLRHLPGWRRTWRTFMKRRDEVDRVIAGLIAQRRVTGSSRQDVLASLLGARRPDRSSMSASELRDNLVSVVVAGHETTASTLAWAFQLIAHHKRVQNRLLAEIDADDGQSYMHATISEVLRHRPVFLFAAPRAVTQPIEIGGWTYRPPAHLLGCTYLMHHDPALFPMPHEFRPERFLSGGKPSRTWLPWGGGRKLCPGRHLALLEIQAVLRATLSKYRLQPVDRKIEHARWRSALLTPHAGSKVALQPRKPSMYR